MTHARVPAAPGVLAGERRAYNRKGDLMIKLKRLLLPTDLSESARHAFTYAVSFAREYAAELYLLHVVEVLPMGYAGELFPESMAQVVQQISSHVRVEVDKLAAEARARGCATVHARIAQGKP